jgi:hypothetical protein
LDVEFDRSDFLKGLIDFFPGESGVVITLPTDDNNVRSIVALYLRYGIVPHRVPKSMLLSLSKVANYLLLNEINAFTLEDSLLNRFSPLDREINQSTKLVHLTLPVLTHAHLTRRTEIGYPVLRQSKLNLLGLKRPRLRHRFQYIAPQLTGCDYCDRRALVTGLLKIDGLVIAGGYCCFLFSCFAVNCRSVDIDLFMVGQDRQQWPQIVKQIEAVYKEYLGGAEYICMRSAYAVSFFRLNCSLGHKDVVQLILREIPTRESVLETFDLDGSCFLLDQDLHMYTNRRGLRYLQTGHVNIVDLKRRSPTMERRLLKYSRNYGSGIAVPGFDLEKFRASSSSTGLGFLLRAPYDGCTYKLVNCCGIRDLADRLKNILRHHPAGRLPFILRKNNSGVFDLSEAEQKLFDPGPAVFSGYGTSQGWFETAYFADDENPAALEEKKSPPPLRSQIVLELGNGDELVLQPD